MKNILIIEDNELIREALASTLRTHLKDCNVLTAVNGKEGVNILGSTPLDLILTDLQMPVLDGYGVIEYKNRNHPQMPLIVMTADNTHNVKRKLNALGISQHIEKPFDFKKVTDKILDKLSEAPNTAAGFAGPLH